MYIDTNILIYLLEQHKQYSTAAADILQAHTDGGGKLITASLTITEFMAGTTASDSSVLHRVPNLAFITLDTSLAEQAAQLQRKAKLHIGDAIHLATALQAQAECFFSNDQQLLKIAQQYLPVKSL
jgi:predicted nucleic acid-binding protein